ncbi:TPA: hypothetical protein ACGIK9_002936 [Acinetobacter baumannii]|uniref:hypothetical protein n=1 Tax=Acinetobacter baumannii TaxID=470 RepID=UPI00338E0565
MTAQDNFERSVPVSLKDFMNHIVPCGAQLSQANVLSEEMDIFPQESLNQQRKNLTASLENMLPNDLASDFMNYHIVPIQARNDTLSLIATTEFNKQKKSVLEKNLGIESNVEFTDEKVDIYSNDMTKVYNQEDSWLPK